MTETLRESQVTEISDKLRVYSQLIEEVKIGQVDVSELDSMIDTIEKWLLEGQLNTFDKLMSYYVLGHAYCTKKCQLYAPSEAMYNNHIAMKEIYYYRMTLFVVNGIMQKSCLVFSVQLSVVRIRLMFILEMYTTISVVIRMPCTHTLLQGH